jgi:outer membrane protein TolC
MHRSSSLRACTKAIVFLCSAGVTLFPLGASCQTVTQLSLTEALRMALANNPAPRGADARVREAESKLRGASAPQNPILNIAHGAGKDTGGLDEDILATQVFELGDKWRHRVRGAKAERDAAIAERADKRTDLEFNVRSAYYAAARSDAEYKLAAAALETARAFLKAAETQFQAGDVPKSNVLRSQIELSRAEQGLASADTEMANRFASLKSLIGALPDASISLTDPLAFQPVPVSLPGLRDHAAKRRPDIIAAERIRDARRAAVGSARAQNQPDLFVEGRHAAIEQYPGANSVRAGMTIPLFDYGRNRAEVQTARAALQEQDFILQETIRTALLEVDTAFRDLAQARKTVESFTSGRLNRSRELLEMAQIGYEHGANNYLELLDAQQVYRSEQVEYARALASYNTAKAALQKAVGGAFP